MVNIKKKNHMKKKKVILWKHCIYTEIKCVYHSENHFRPHLSQCISNQTISSSSYFESNNSIALKFMKISMKKLH